MPRPRRNPSQTRKSSSAPTGLVLAALGLTALLITGCTSLGPTTVPEARFDYNRAVARSWDEQLLLNLVRLRYRDTPHFLELSSVVAQYSRSGSAGIAPILIEGGGNEATLGADFEVYERPTLTLTPLEGKELVQQLLKPLAPTDLVLLSQAGWSLFRLMQCCVQEVLGPDDRAMRNALRAAGPTPVLLRRDEYEDFQELSRKLRDLQVRGALRTTIEPARTSPGKGSGQDGKDEGQQGKGGEDDEQEVFLLLEESPETAEDLAFVKQALGLDAQATRLQLVDHRAPSQGEISVVGRSLMSVLFFLSQGVQAPEADVLAERVTVTRDDDGRPLDWNRVIGDLLHVHHSTERPQNAAVQIHYRGSWFYIDDSDLQSKSTFLLLSQLFSLQAGSSDGRSPLLTVSAGGG